MLTKGHTIDVLDKGYVRYVDHMGDDLRIVETARISYKSPSKGPDQDKKLLFYLYKHLHTSPFESVNITFNIKMPILVMRQFVRHRTQSLNEVSARYTELEDIFYIPTEWRKQDTKNKQGSLGTFSVEENAVLSKELLDFCNTAYNTYEKLLEKGVARELARMVLPVNIYTEIYTTMNLKNLLHLIRLREDSHAQYEIQVYAKAMKDICNNLFPWTMEAYNKYKIKVVED